MLLFIRLSAAIIKAFTSVELGIHVSNGCADKLQLQKMHSILNNSL